MILKSRFYSTEWLILLSLATLKVTVHFLTINNFELHRDAYLYYAQGQHLAWGYISVPPSTALIGNVATLIFGNTPFALRFFPAIIGGLTIVTIGLTVMELGGQKKAIALAGLAYLLSPSYLHTNFLFQPVAFNQFYWTLFMYLTIVMVKRRNPKFWIWIAVVFGFGFLNKYSIVFIFGAFAIALLASPHRHLFLSKYLFWGVIVGFIIILPNLIWQFQHNWPVLHHMSELRSMQLVHVRYSDFIISQLLMNIQAVLIWILGLVGLLFFKNEKNFRFYGLCFILLILIIMAGSGKPYYTLGIYPILFAFGAYFIEKYVRKYFYIAFGVLVIHMLVSLYFSLSFDGVPFMTIEKMVKKEAFKWEDGMYYDIPQDMADMTGWKEIGTSVREIYLGLGIENKDNCHIYCGHYGQAGAVLFYGNDIGIPNPISPNASFLLWTPDSIYKDHIIYIHSDLNNDFNPEERLPQLFEKVQLVKTIDNNYFRENGTQILLCSYPNQECKDFYKSMITELKDKYR
ncbi:glycosyltransferase family 39 protein [Hyphobacterium sp. CCMP332]|nr:glycosyltransferase family 39 protein [Hyphobacterium sp. CCMP332]